MLPISNRQSIRPDVFCKKGFLKSFTKSTGKHLCWSIFFNKVGSLRPSSLLKKRLRHQCFPVNFAEFLRTLFLPNISGGYFCSRDENVVKVLKAGIFVKKDCLPVLFKRAFFIHRMFFYKFCLYFNNGMIPSTKMKS